MKAKQMEVNGALKISKWWCGRHKRIIIIIMVRNQSDVLRNEGRLFLLNIRKDILVVLAVSRGASWATTVMKAVDLVFRRVHIPIEIAEQVPPPAHKIKRKAKTWYPHLWSDLILKCVPALFRLVDILRAVDGIVTANLVGQQLIELLDAVLRILNVPIAPRKERAGPGTTTNG